MKRISLRFLFLLTFHTIIQGLQPVFSIPPVQRTSLKYDTAEVNTLLEQGKKYFNSDPDKAISLGLQARDLALKIKFKKGEAYALKNIGIAYYIRGDYDKTLNYWE